MKQSKPGRTVVPLLTGLPCLSREGSSAFLCLFQPPLQVPQRLEYSPLNLHNGTSKDSVRPLFER